jgi:hypothetical protein
VPFLLEKVDFRSKGWSSNKEPLGKAWNKHLVAEMKNVSDKLIDPLGMAKEGISEPDL